MSRHILSLRSNAKRHLYFIAAAGLIKIGITDGLAKRVDTLRTQSPVPIELMLTVRGTRRHEAGLHLLFSAERSHGEWFRATDRLVSFVDELKRMTAEQIAARLNRLRTPVVDRHYANLRTVEKKRERQLSLAVDLPPVNRKSGRKKAAA